MERAATDTARPRAPVTIRFARRPPVAVFIPIPVAVVIPLPIPVSIRVPSVARRRGVHIRAAAPSGGGGAAASAAEVDGSAVHGRLSAGGSRSPWPSESESGRLRQRSIGLLPLSVPVSVEPSPRAEASVTLIDRVERIGRQRGYMRDACGGGFSSRLSPRSVPDCEIFTRFGPVLEKKTRVSTAPESVPPSHCAGGGAPGWVVYWTRSRNVVPHRGVISYYITPWSRGLLPNVISSQGFSEVTL
jgi:hypothetical protein